MIPQRLRRLSRAVLGGFLIGSSLIGYAQENESPGLVRITDARPKGVPIRNASLGHAGRGEYHNIGGNYAGSGDCPECYGDGHGHHGHKGLFREHYCKHSPDHGYSTPGKIPIYRRGVQYNQYFPAAWYGTANGGITAGNYPQIYQPTDTTQLGFYYQHVPYWQPNPNALPPRPIPAQWHRRVPTANAPWNNGGWGHGYGGGAYCPPGSGWTESSTLTPTPMQSAPTATPAPTPVPAAPPQDDSALNLHIRRAGF